ncbi:unnamed protein product [Cunninghamella echinulata]
MNDKKHYIELSKYKIKHEGNYEKKHEIDNTESWIIAYKKDINRYLCKRKSSDKIVEMDTVESFITQWNNDQYNIIRDTYNGMAQIIIYIENEYFSGYKCSKGIHGTSKISEDTILRYTHILKDITEERKDDSHLSKNIAEESKDDSHLSKNITEERKDDSHLSKNITEERKDDSHLSKNITEERKDDSHLSKNITEERKDDSHLSKNITEERKDDSHLSKNITEEITVEGYSLLGLNE